MSFDILSPTRIFYPEKFLKTTTQKINRKPVLTLAPRLALSLSIELVLGVVFCRFPFPAVSSSRSFMTVKKGGGCLQRVDVSPAILNICCQQKPVAAISSIQKISK